MNAPPSDRVLELVQSLKAAAKRGSVFHNFNPVRKPGIAARLKAYESDLAGLDEAAWAALKNAAVRRHARMRQGDLESLCDLLNEAKGYRHLETLGCRDIAFVPATYDRKTPDLAGTLNAQPVLCEVKTINFTYESAPAFVAGKFTKIIAEAKAQMDAAGRKDARAIVYLIVNGGTDQLHSLLRTASFAGIEVEIFMAPAAT